MNMSFSKNDPETIRNIYRLITLRFFLVIFCFLGMYFLNSSKNNFLAETTYRTAYLFLLGLFILNFIYLLIARFLQDYFLAFVITQIFVDLVAETMVIYCTGGLLSIFTFLYFVSILSAGLLISIKVSLFCASIASIGISGIVIIYYLAVNN